MRRAIAVLFAAAVLAGAAFVVAQEEDDSKDLFGLPQLENMRGGFKWDGTTGYNGPFWTCQICYEECYPFSKAKEHSESAHAKRPVAAQDDGTITLDPTEDSSSIFTIGVNREPVDMCFEDEAGKVRIRISARDGGLITFYDHEGQPAYRIGVEDKTTTETVIINGPVEKEAE